MNPSLLSLYPKTRLLMELLGLDVTHSIIPSQYNLQAPLNQLNNEFRNHTNTELPWDSIHPNFSKNAMKQCPNNMHRLAVQPHR